MGLTCFSSFGSSNVRFGSTLGYHTENERSIIPPQKNGFLLDSERHKKGKRTARLPLISFLGLLDLFSCNLFLFLLHTKAVIKAQPTSVNSQSPHTRKGEGGNFCNFTPFTTHTHLVLRLLGPSRLLFRVSSLGGHDFVLGLRGRGCFSNLVSKKSVTFSNVERRIGRKRTAEGSVSMERKRSNEAGFGRLTKLNYRI